MPSSRRSSQPRVWVSCLLFGQAGSSTLLTTWEAPVLKNWGFTPMASFDRNYLYKDPVSKYNYIGSYGFNI